MKIIKGLAITLFLTTIFGSCFDPPEFPTTPKIEFQFPELNKNLEYYAPDSLVIHINFKDGDGDLGLTTGIDDEPFHREHFYITNNGRLDSLGTVYLHDSLKVINIPDPTVGKLATIRTKDDPLYKDKNVWGGKPIPPYRSTSSCKYPYVSLRGSNSNAQRVYVSAEDTLALETPASSLVSVTVGGTKYYALQDTFLIKDNPNHFNFDAEILIQDPTTPGNYIPYDWAMEQCSTIDGRFPPLSDTERTLEGDLTYSQKISGLNDFLGRSLKIRIQITDRALHRSNVLTSNPFQLDKIRRNQ
jgi:hypothetical protein